jgi:chemotaxis protein CheX
MQFDDSQLKQITEDTWRLVVGEELGPGAISVEIASIEESIAACAQIVGAWNLAAVLYCSTILARHAVAQMSDGTPESVTTEDIQDTMCELINIIAGNIKGALSDSSFLSLPSAVKGSDFRLRFPRHVLLSEVSFQSNGQPLLVRLLGEDKAAAQIEAAKPFVVARYR